jgi:hypothetical protein
MIVQCSICTQSRCHLVLNRSNYRTEEVTASFDMVGVKLTNNGKTAGTDSQIQQRLNHSAKNAFSESSRKRCISGLS